MRAEELSAGYEYLRPIKDSQALQPELWQVINNLRSTNLLCKDFDELRSKEELLYYRIFKNIFGDQMPALVIGRTRSVTRNELFEFLMCRN